MGQYTYQEVSAEDSAKKHSRQGNRGFVTLIRPQGYVTSTNDTIAHNIHAMCTVVSYDAPTLSRTEDTQTALGKTPYTMVTDVTMDEVNITVMGNAVKTQMAFFGKDYTATPAIELTGKPAAQNVHIAVFSHKPESDDLAAIDIFLNCQVFLNELPANADGQVTTVITVRSHKPKMVRIDASQGYSLGSELWLDSGNVVNANAPDGALTTYTLGTSNVQDATSSLGTPTAVQWDPDGTGYKQYFITVQADGVEQTTSQVTATGTVITTTSALPAGTALYAMYVVADSTMPHSDNFLSPTWENLD